MPDAFSKGLQACLELLPDCLMHFLLLSGSVLKQIKKPTAAFEGATTKRQAHAYDENHSKWGN